MFHAMRAWWMDGRGKLTARLFVFEFIVVMAGVLAAQALQNWVSQRGALARMEESRERTLRESSDNLAYALAWRAGVPCVDSRLREIMRRASDSTVPSALIQRPRFPSFIQTPVDDQSELLLRQRHGDRSADMLNVLRSDFGAANDRTTAIVEAWGRLSLVDTALGAVSPADRTAVRTAAADIRASLRSLDNVLAHAGVVAGQARISPRSEDPFRSAANCAEIWRSGVVAIPTGPAG